MLLNLPVAYYTTWFRPQLFGFFILDFERGFSFCWWLKIIGVVLASVWLLRQLGLQSRGLALFAGLWILLSLQWWLSSPTMLPEMIASGMICCGCAVAFFTQTSRWRLAVAFSVFVYCGLNFALCFYPPGQIPLLYFMAAVLIGFVVERRNSGAFCRVGRGTFLLGGAIATIAIVLVPCFIDIRPTLELVSQTAYPGSRRRAGGGLSLFELLSGFAGFFPSTKPVPALYQSAVGSHSFPAWPAVIVAVIAARVGKRIPIPGLLIALIVLLLSLSIYCLVPLPGWLVCPTLLCFATEFSTRLGIGLSNVFLLCFFLDRYRFPVLPRRGVVLVVASFAIAIVLIFWTATRGKPQFFPDPRQIALSFVASVALVALFYSRKAYFLFPATLLALVLVTHGNVNPLVRGLSPLLQSEGFRAIDKIRAADPDGIWIGYQDLILPELIKATGARVLNGLKIVPDLDFLHRFDPSGRANFVYNRYGHLVCALPESPGEVAFKFVAADYYILNVSPGDSRLRLLGCRYVVLPIAWSEAELHGFSLIEQLPGERVYIYRQQ
jgi:hypothetical protein